MLFRDSHSDVRVIGMGIPMFSMGEHRYFGEHSVVNIMWTCAGLSTMHFGSSGLHVRGWVYRLDFDDSFPGYHPGLALTPPRLYT